MSILKRAVISILGINKWLDIESAPKLKGFRFLAKTKEGFIFITEYRPEDVESDGCYSVVDSCCGNYEDMRPTQWMELPE